MDELLLKYGLTQDDITRGSQFLDRFLEKQIPGVFERRYPAYRYASGELLPTDTILDIGDTDFVTNQVETFGEPTFISGDNDDFNLVSAAVSEVKRKVQVAAISFEYNLIQQARTIKAASNGQQSARSLVPLKGAEIAAKKMVIFNDRIAAYGSAKHGLEGKLNLSDVDVDIEAFDIYDPNTTPDETIDFVNDKITSFEAPTLDVETVNYVEFPSTFYRRLSTVRRTGVEQTVLQAIQASNPGVRFVKSYYGAASFLERFGVNPPGTGLDRIHMANLQEDTLRRHTSQIIRVPTQVHHLKYVSYMLQAMGSVYTEYEKAHLYVDVPTAPVGQRYPDPVTGV